MSEGSDDLVSTLQGIAAARPALQVQANVTVTVDGHKLAVTTAEDDRIRVQVPSLSAGLSILRGERRRLPDLAGTLNAAGLTVEIRSGNAVVAVAGAGASPGVIAGLLSLGPVEVRLGGLLAATLRLR